MTVLAHTEAKVFPTSRKIWIDAVRGYAISLVVVGHVIQSGSNGDFDFFTHPVFSAIYTFHMPLFMLMSGYVAAASFGRQPFLPLIWSRMRSLLVPILAWTVLASSVVFVLRFLFGDSLASDGTAQYIFSGLLNPSSLLWFPWILFVASVISRAFMSLRPKLGLIPVILSVPIVWVLPITQYFGFFQLKWLYPFFIAGLVLSTLKAQLVRWEILGTATAGVGFIGMLLFWQRDFSVYISQMQFDTEDFGNSLLTYGFRYLIALCGAVASVGIIRAIARRRNVGLLAKVGITSMGIYCIQTFLVIVFSNTPSPSTQAWVFILLYTPVVTTLVLGTSYFLTSQLLERVKYLRIILLGGR
jgi:fucose 4-O-acetylase-like acetyltransferase